MTTIETFTTEGIFQPTMFEVPQEYISDIDFIKSRVTEELPDVITQGILYKTLEHAKKIRQSDSYFKPDISLSKSNRIQRVNNCTDDSSIQIQLLNAVGVTSFAKFNAGHASVVVQDGDEFWHLDDDSSIGVKKSTVLDTHIDEEKIKVTSEAMSSIGNNAGFYLYRDEFCSWQPQFISAERGIRKSSPYYNNDKILDGATVLIMPPLGLQMLTAIDVLETMNSNDLSNEASIAKTLLRSKLIQFVPKLRSSSR